MPPFLSESDEQRGQLYNTYLFQQEFAALHRLTANLADVAEALCGSEPPALVCCC